MGAMAVQRIKAPAAVADRAGLAGNTAQYDGTSGGAFSAIHLMQLS